MTKQVVLKNLSKFKKPLILLLFLIIFVSIFSLLAIPKINKNQKTESASLTNLDTIIKDGNARAFATVAEEIGPQKSYELVRLKFPNNDTKAHDFAHVVGIVSFEKQGVAGLGVCDTAYNYGCYHGFIEAFIATNTVAKVSQIESGCIALGAVHAPSCLHGIGHGVLVDASYNLDKALENCSILQSTSQIYCWDGVFMERIVGSMQNETNKLVMTKETLLAPCDRVKTTYQEQCWRNQVSSWFRFFQGNTKDIGEQCSLIETRFQKTCFESLGLMVTITYGENAPTLISACQVITQNQISDDCIIGSLKELLFEGKQAHIAASLCNSVSPANRDYCQLTFRDHLAQSQARFGR